MKINFDEILDVVKSNQEKVIILRETKCIGKTKCRKIEKLLYYHCYKRNWIKL